MTEIWLPVLGYENSYSISNQARVRSEDRIVPWNGTMRHVKSRILSQHLDPQGYLRVGLSIDGILTSKLVHVLLLESFIGPRPLRMQGLHWDDNRTNNDLENLRWGTPSENGTDAVRNNKNRWSIREKCNHGHSFTPENTGYRKGTSKRYCKRCKAINTANYRQKAKAA